MIEKVIYLILAILIPFVVSMLLIHWRMNNHIQNKKDTFSGQMEELKEASDNLTFEIGKVLEPVLSEIVKFINRHE